VNSKCDQGFWQDLADLPPETQELARKNFRLWLENPRHPSLQFKPLASKKNVWSVRVGEHYRALCTRDGDDYVWFWIGSHAEYDRLI